VNPDGTISRVSILWQVLAFVVITVAEILISVTGLELAFTAAPQSMKGFVTSLWLVTVGMANLLINKPVTQMYPGKELPAISFLNYKLFDLPAFTKFNNAADYFLALTIAMLIVTAVFVLMAKRFNRSQAGGS
jgi:solute carrier family 15 (oligopeptide transporter), member 1